GWTGPAGRSGPPRWRGPRNRPPPRAPPRPRPHPPAEQGDVQLVAEYLPAEERAQGRVGVLNVQEDQMLLLLLGPQSLVAPEPAAELRHTRPVRGFTGDDGAGQRLLRRLEVVRQDLDRVVAQIVFQLGQN